MFFNPLCTVNNRSVKYGVISHDDLLQDLREWSSLYVAGRMMKPYGEFQGNGEVEEAVEVSERSE